MLGKAQNGMFFVSEMKKRANSAGQSVLWDKLWQIEIELNPACGQRSQISESKIKAIKHYRIYCGRFMIYWEWMYLNNFKRLKF